MDSVLDATHQIAKLKPSYMSVTYGARGGTDEFTANIASEIQKTHNVPSLAHMTCITATKQSVQAQLKNLQDLHILSLFDNFLFIPLYSWRTKLRLYRLIYLELTSQE